MHIRVFICVAIRRCSNRSKKLNEFYSTSSRPQKFSSSPRLLQYNIMLLSWCKQHATIILVPLRDAVFVCHVSLSEVTPISNSESRMQHGEFVCLNVFCCMTATRGMPARRRSVRNKKICAVRTFFFLPCVHTFSHC